MTRRLLMAWSVVLIWLGAFPVSADDMLILYYHERPPYSTKQPDGSVRGITADIAARALAAAGIAYRWEDLPSARQLEVIRRDEGPACALGWFKRPDREAYAKFSTPLYRDPPTIVVARADDERFAGALDIDALFANKALILLAKTGYSYGGEIDGKIASEAPNLRRDPSDNRAMLAMVSRKRVDYMIMAEEEATDLLKEPDLADANLTIYHLMDAPAGEYRYLICSKSVPDALIERFDQALPKSE